jgi:16S rRNA (cytosine967-C5)-methyltransferase
VNTSADRLVAARLLLRVEQGAYASRLLSDTGAPGVRTRVLGVLRWQRALYHVLATLVRRPFSRLDAEVRTALAIGLFETSQLAVPPAVATDGAVHLIRKLGKKSAAGMINAVLRRAPAAWHEQLAGASPDLTMSHPAWLYQRWAEQLGAETATAMMASNQAPAATWIWVTDDTVLHQLREAGVGLHGHPWCPGAWAAPQQTRALIAAVQEGAAYAQDPASQLVAQLALALYRQTCGARPGRVVDLCAAPGGKIALLLRDGEWRQALAVDLRLQRLRLLRQLPVQIADRAGLVVADGRQPPLPAQSWDLVLLDAPCSGTGTLCRHPELCWRLTPERISELAEIQAQLIAGAASLVAPGGLLVYATCSVEPEENEALLTPLPAQLEVAPINELMPEGAPWRATPTGGVRLLPSAGNDGFTIHAVTRRGDPAHS